MKLSIITINYNNNSGLQKTLESVRNQTDKLFEHIIVDGSSVDESVTTIEHYVIEVNDKYPILWVSEKDNGIYHAMNKGIAMANGDYVQFLNSGDTLANDEVVHNMYLSLEQYNYPHILIGNMIKLFSNGSKFNDRALNHTDVSMLTFYQGTLNHSPAYISRRLFAEFGVYDETYKIVSDFKWYLEVVGLNSVPIQLVDIDVTLFDMGGISETNVELCQKERREVLETALPKSVLADYDRWYFTIMQKKRMERYPILNKLVYVTERCLFKYERLKR